VVHLAPVAAALGNGSTSAVVVDMGSSGTSICCVDDAVVLPPVSSRVNLQLGLTRIAAALVGWMGCYGHWPVQLQQAAGGPSLGCVVQQQQQSADDDAAGGSSSSSSVGAVDVYCCLMLEELVMQQCYFPKVRTAAAAADPAHASTCRHTCIPRQHTCSHSTQTALYCGQQMILSRPGPVREWLYVVAAARSANIRTTCINCLEACFLVAKSVAIRCSGSLCHDEGHAVGLSCVQGHCCQRLSCNITLPAHLMC
jgi:hypothetical protein